MSFPPLFPRHRVRLVGSFEELATARFADGVNALCWPRGLAGDFAAVVAALGEGEELESLDEEKLMSLRLDHAGVVARDLMLHDLRLLRSLELDPVLNLIHAYPRDEEGEVVATDVFSFHADSAPVEADTWLCTYHGPSSEGLANEEAVKRVDLPEIRAELLKLFGGADGPEFREFLRDHCYDLHYATLPRALPYAFGLGNLWRIATEWPGSPVPPCVHRAPATRAGEKRLLLIS